MVLQVLCAMSVQGSSLPLTHLRVSWGVRIA